MPCQRCTDDVRTNDRTNEETSDALDGMTVWLLICTFHKIRHARMCVLWVNMLRCVHTASASYTAYCIQSLYGNGWREWCAHLSAFIILLDTFYCALLLFRWIFYDFILGVLLRFTQTRTQTHGHTGTRWMVTINRISSTFHFSPWMCQMRRQTVFETIFILHSFAAQCAAIHLLLDGKGSSLKRIRFFLFYCVRSLLRRPPFN